MSSATTENCEQKTTHSDSLVEMYTEEYKDIFSGTFTWRVEHFSKLQSKHYSDVFIIGGFKWRILMYPRGCRGDGYLAIYLYVADASTLPSGWSICAQFMFTVVNQLNRNKSKTLEFHKDNEFKEEVTTLGYRFVTLSFSKLHDCTEGYLVNDTCIIEVKVYVLEAEIDEDENEEGSSSLVKSTEHSLIAPNSEAHCEQLLPSNDKPSSLQICSNNSTDSPTGPRVVKLPEKEKLPYTTPASNLIDFKGLGWIEKAFVPLLEECQQKRSRKFTECAFTALGRVLPFLKTAKSKDMTSEDSCDHLELLWEELEIFRFDLSWLKSYVQSALCMKKFEEMTWRVKRLREDVDALEIKLRRRRTELIEAEVDLDRVAESDLVNLREIDMDRELGYGGH
ncbi:hypothetical protein D8674_020891 [Pyrus ussuriensis x Pyrus communis]|uniref:MATH domain-containing protein n=1 Tax=Pyrus ussuriensis x Pyrus communis TaxID=2448454 RepID=A0A5N5HKZ7_9ROSA|nr:hypothetical protein D8674_020891 [Pyrus ussuriensis x Pyrus communis]